jgi:hypothetical protein
MSQLKLTSRGLVLKDVVDVARNFTNLQLSTEVLNKVMKRGQPLKRLFPKERSFMASTRDSEP